MNKKLTAVLAATTMVGAIGFTSIASADYSLYGTLRAGAVYSNSDKANEEAVWDLGATGNDGTIGGQGLYSRIGVMGSTDLGNGSSAGLVIERDVTGDGFTPRQTNVWVGGSWGQLTLGNQDNPYRNARNWDQTWFMGGQFGNTESRYEGVKYSSKLSGPFQFSILAIGNNGNAQDKEAAVIKGCTADNINQSHADGLEECDGATEYVAETFFKPAVAAVIDATGAVVTAAIPAKSGMPAMGNRYVATAAIDEVSSENSVDRWVWTASYDLGGIALNLAHDAHRVDNFGYDSTAFGVNGSAGGFDWFVAYETASDNSAKGDDVESFGGYVSFSLSPKDLLYFYHVSHSLDVSDDKDETVLGYSHSLGTGTTFITEYLTADDGTNEPSVLALVLKVDF